MPDVTLKRFDEMEAAAGGAFVRVRAELGVTAFGMQVLNLPPHFDAPFAEHAHEGTDRPFANTGQEEVYVPLSGSATLIADGERWELAPGMAARIGPAQVRKIVTGEEPFTYLAVGGTPGRPYEPPEFSELGAGDVPPAAR